VTSIKRRKSLNNQIERFEFCYHHVCKVNENSSSYPTKNFVPLIRENNKKEREFRLISKRRLKNIQELVSDADRFASRKTLEWTRNPNK